MAATNFQISGTDLNSYFLSDANNSGSSASRNVYNTGFTTNSNDIDMKRFVLNDPAISKNNIGMTWVASNSIIADWSCTAMNELGNRAVAAAWNGGIYYSMNYGVDWIQSNAPNDNYTGLAMSYDGSIVYSCAGAGSVPSKVRRSIDGGQTWVDKLYDYYFNGVACSYDGTCVIAIVYSNYIYYSSNSGDTWTQSNAPTARWYSVSMSKTGKYAIATNNELNPQVYYSSDYGATWTGSSVNSDDIRSCAMSASGKYAVVGNFSTATPSYSTNYGQTFTRMTPSTNETSTTMNASYFKSIVMSGIGKEVLFTNATNSNAGYIYYSGCYGKNYANTNTPSKPFKSISMSKNGMYAICGTYQDKIYVSKSIQTTGYNITKKITNIYDACESSSSWIKIGNSTGTLATAISGDGSKIVLISTNGYFFVTTTNSGINWTLLTNPSNVTSWNSVCITYNGNYIYALGTVNISGTNTTRLYQIGSNNTFTEKFNIGSLWSNNYIATSWDGKYVAFALNNNDIRVSSNYGASPNSQNYGYPWSGIAMSADGKYITVTAGDSSSFHATYHSYDYGSTFINLNQGQTYNQRMGGMSDSGAIVLFGSNSDTSVLLSRTYNGTFYSIQYNNNISTGFYNGAVSGTGQYMFIINNISGTSGYISVSQDYGKNWKTISWADGYANTISISNSAESAVLTTSTANIYYLSGNPVTVQMDLGLLYHKPIPFSNISYNASCAYYPLANSFEEIYGNNTNSYRNVYEQRSSAVDGYFYSDKLTFESAGGRYGLYLPGTSSYWASVPFYPDTQTNSYTICFWIYLLRARDYTIPDVQTIFSVYPGTINVDTNDNGNGWSISMYMLYGNGLVAEKIYTNKDNLKTWNHVALKYQYNGGTTATANLYLNGTMITNSNTNNRYNTYASSQIGRQMLIGTNADGQARRTNAYYRDLMLFSSALSDTEITEIYNYTI